MVEIRQRNIKFFLHIDPYEWIMNCVWDITSWRKSPFSFHERWVVNTLITNRIDHERWCLRTTPLASPHEQLPPRRVLAPRMKVSSERWEELGFRVLAIDFHQVIFFVTSVLFIEPLVLCTKTNYCHWATITKAHF